MGVIMTTNYRIEFPDFGELDVTLPPSFDDFSWHNDVCPCFMRDNLMIWIDFKDPARREFTDALRFSLWLVNSDGEYIETICHTDNYEEILKHIPAM